METVLKIAVLGAGRMGKQVLQSIGRADGCQLGGVWVRTGSSLLGQDLSDFTGRKPEPAGASTDIDAVVATADVAIDFSLPEAAPVVVEAALDAGKPLVCGVTGLGATDLDALHAAATEIPVLYDRNMSTGIAVLTGLVAQAAAALGGDFEAEIHETHHMHKKDAPSGTALKLGEALADARGQDFAAVSRYSPDNPDERGASGEIVFRVTRRGEVPGKHAVRFATASETLELRHEVVSRQVFADGAVRAARWLTEQGPGFYSTLDLLG